MDRGMATENNYPGVLERGFPVSNVIFTDAFWGVAPMSIISTDTNMEVAD